MELWQGVAIAAGSLLLHTCLLFVVSYLLRRHIAYHSERILQETRLRAQGPSPAHCHPPATKEAKGTWTGRDTPVSALHCRHDSDTSSGSSDTGGSASSRCLPPTRQARKDVDYTQVVFSGRKKDPALDYENMKEATDYVNLHPTDPEPDFWTFVNPAVSEPVEYTQVAI